MELIKKYEKVLNLKKELIKELENTKIINDLTVYPFKSEVDYENVTYCNAYSCIEKTFNNRRGYYNISEEKINNLCDIKNKPLSKSQRDYVWAGLLEATNILNEVERNLTLLHKQILKQEKLNKEKNNKNEQEK